MKKFQSQGQAKVARVTSVLEPDGPQDDIRDRLVGVEVAKGTMTDKQKLDISRIEQDYSEILAKDPGCTDKVCFTIDTGENAPLFQRAYNTPIALKDNIDRELD